MELVRALKALADPLRLRVLAAVSQNELTVGEVQEVVQSVQSSVSRNLAILRDAGFIRDRKEGTNVYFSLREDMPAPARAIYQSTASRLAELPEVKSDQARLRACLRRRIARSRDYFERIAGDWERIRKSYFDDRVTSLAIEKLLPCGLVLADIGCGTGALTLELARLAKRVIGIDLSPAMIENAKRRAREKGLTNVEFRLGDAAKLPLAAASVDGAFCVMVLHFVEDPARAVHELCRITKPGGPVIVVDLVPHRQTWLQTEMAHRWLGFDRGAVEKWLRAGGAKDVEYELSGRYAGHRAAKNGKGRVELFVARGRLAAGPSR
ncbi:MAG TPA: metalloregulator ArsR/SmtB family transcription factor [Candidatus Acidoferrales bacterium]|nr:metalloregulator ArsR/SmtB family transcription factor [Candidatus Acidoferrales bacterium]